MRSALMNHLTPTDGTRDYTVRGMTCSHCVLSVRDEVSDVRGVSSVDVDLDSGRVTVAGRDIDEEAVRAAVAEAGYEVGA
jgi:copper chaperone